MSGGVEDDDRALADHLHHARWADQRGGVLVDSHPEQRGRLGDQREQPPDPIPLLEVLVDDHPGQQPQPGAHLGHALLWGRAAGAEGDHVAADGRCAGAGAGHHHAVPMALDDRAAEGGAAHHARQPQLVATGHEDAGRRRHRGRHGRVVGVVAGERPQPDNFGHPERAEEGLVQLGCLIAER